MEWTERCAFFFRERDSRSWTIQDEEKKHPSGQIAPWINSEQSKQPTYFRDSEWRRILSENDRRFWARNIEQRWGTKSV